MCSTFVYMIEHQIYIDQFEEFAVQEKQKFIKFLHFITAEINERFEETVMTIQKVKEYEEKEAVGNFNPGEEEVEEHRRNQSMIQ